MSSAFVLGLILAFAPPAPASSAQTPMITRVKLNHGRFLSSTRAGVQDVGPAIVGGNRISIEQSPWQAAVLAILSKTEALLCGGTILNTSEVLTAGHCTYDPSTLAPIPADQIIVVAGTANLSQAEPGEQFTLASSVRVHPYYVYNPTATQPTPDDVAVLSLETPFSFTGAVQPISLTPPGSLLAEGTAVNLTGFGEETPFEEPSGELNAIAMTLGSSRECGGEDNALFLCASTPTGSDCLGDSGSALTVPGSPATLVGLTNTVEVIDGEPCRDGAVGGFANVGAPEIRDFITEDASAPPHAPRGGGVFAYGVPVVGNTLTCEPGEWSYDPVFTYLFINSADGQVLQDGSSSTYLLSKADVGRTILCEVLATNAGGTGVGRTSATSPVDPSRAEEEAATRREEEAAAQKREEEAASAKRHEEEATTAKRHEEEAAAKKHEEEKSSTPTSEQGVAGFQAIAPPTPPPVPDAQLPDTALQASLSGVVDVKVSCPAGESICVGTVTLRTLGAVSASLAADAKKKRSVLTLAAGSFTVAGGKVVTVKLHLSARARALLAHGHLLRARATVVARDPTGATHTAQTIVTLRAAKAKQGKGR